MKLAEALIERAALQKQLKALTERINNSIRVEEGDKPVEIIEELVAEYLAANEELSTLIIRINQTNATTDSGHQNLSITALIENRDREAREMNVYDSLATQVPNENRAYRDYRSKDDVKFVLSYNPRDYRKRADSLAKSIRTMDAKLQAANWTTDLL